MDNANTAAKTTDAIIYEQPINEHTRVCLRLEHLFAWAAYCLNDSAVWSSRTAMVCLVDILNILDRPDLKTKLTKELNRHLANFARLEQVPNVDNAKLGAILVELENMLDRFQSLNGKFAQGLRDNEFLTTIRQHLSHPGGACGFETPGYHMWLQQDSSTRINDLRSWFDELALVQNTVNLLLRLIRQSGVAQLKIAQGGFYQESLSTQMPCQLVRVSVPLGENVYPEISAGRHGLCIRFLTLNLIDRALQTTHDTRFSLTCCIL